MQQLQFEPSWDKTLSQKDRERIEQIFHKTTLVEQNSPIVTPLWQAVNYRGELLVTVFVHNMSNETLKFQNKTLRYMEKGELIAEYTFLLPSLNIESQTSMPWTFIFPARSLSKDATLESGNLKFH